MAQDKPRQYTRLVGYTAKYPYIVGVSTHPVLGSGILLSPRLVLTCNHTVNPENPASARAQVITSFGASAAEALWVDSKLDLALLELEREIQSPRPRFREVPLSTGEALMAVGIQESPEHSDALTVAEIELKFANRNEAGGEALDLQFTGGARPGYSGAPVVLEQEGIAHCIGLIRWGHTWSAFSNAIGLAIVRAFLEKHLPGNDLLTHPDDRKEIDMQRLEEAAIGGDPESQYQLARRHADPQSDCHDPEVAARWLRNAAEQGHPECAYHLALAYRDGKGVLPSGPEALRWFRVAAELGHPEAQAVLGRMLLDGSAGYRDAVEAASVLEQAARQGNTDARFQLAMLYFQGALGVAQDDARAFQLLRQVAPSGLPAAQYYLAMMYARGRGTPANPAEALRWAQAALNQQYEGARGLVRELSRR
ncbi:MAG: bifunctional trypsin-like peptidase domain-containing/SEL1-like repeat protein [Acidobacteriia bacterium]|nr:bifunctional trypsin-like peptidase domain-containing/SEL1-like repeat protein [Terriglobia bacterium]